MELYQIVLFAFSMAVFATYFAWIWLDYGIQSSISNTFYKIWERERYHKPNRRWWFLAALWGFSFPLAVIGVEIHPLFFFAAAFIMFVAAAPMFKYKKSVPFPYRASKMQMYVHMVGAIGGIILAMVAFFILKEYWIFGITAGAMAFVSLYRVENTTWWVETIAFVGTWFGLLIISL